MFLRLQVSRVLCNLKQILHNLALGCVIAGLYGEIVCVLCNLREVLHHLVSDVHIMVMGQ